MGDHTEPSRGSFLQGPGSWPVAAFGKLGERLKGDRTEALKNGGKDAAL